MAENILIIGRDEKKVKQLSAIDLVDYLDYSL
jgi:hypothetical protein